MRWLALGFAVGAAVVAAPAGAQGDDGLAAARQRFTQAVADQSAKRYEAALDGFRAVAAVKDTANVRYRIASCLEALGRPAEALASYEAAVRLGAQDPASSDAVQASRVRAAQLDANVARLTVVLPPDAPAGVAVTVDDVALDSVSVGTPVPLDPGHHTLRASAPDRVPFETAVTLSSGGRVSITVTLPPVVAATPPPAPTSRPLAPPPTPSESSSTPVGAWIAVGVGGALAVGSVVSFVLRASNLSTIQSACGSPPVSCPSTRQSELTSDHDAAQVEGPLGIGLAAGAVVSLGIGAWLFASAPPSASSGVVVLPTGPGFVVRGTL